MIKVKIYLKINISWHIKMNVWCHINLNELNTIIHLA